MVHPRVSPPTLDVGRIVGRIDRVITDPRQRYLAMRRYTARLTGQRGRGTAVGKRVTKKRRKRRTVGWRGLNSSLGPHELRLNLFDLEEDHGPKAKETVEKPTFESALPDDPLAWISSPPSLRNRLTVASLINLLRLGFLIFNHNGQLGGGGGSSAASKSSGFDLQRFLTKRFKGTEFHWPGYNYLGPGTRLRERLARGDASLNCLDAIAQKHDVAYSRSRSLSDKHAADRRMIDALGRLKDKTLLERVARRAMQAKVMVGAGRRRRRR